MTSSSSFSVLVPMTPTNRTTSHSSQEEKETSSYHNNNNKKNVEFRFSLCTYNIWFGPPYPEQRMQHVVNNLLSLPTLPTFLGLQEVTPLLQSHLFPLLESLGYHMISQPLHEWGANYGVALGLWMNPSSSSSSSEHSPHSPSMKILQSGFLPFAQTQMDRGLLWVHVHVPIQQEGCDGGSSSSWSSSSIGLLVGTTHLESFLHAQNNGSSQRVHQIRQATEFLVQHMRNTNHPVPTSTTHTTNTNHPTTSTTHTNHNTIIHMAILAGDLNWDDESPSFRSKKSTRTCIDPSLLSIVNPHHPFHNSIASSWSWIDPWQQLHPQEEGYTYDSKLNPMLSGHLRRRFDRCLACWNPHGNHNRLQKQDLVSISISILGQDPIPHLIWKKEQDSSWYSNKNSSGVSKVQERPVLASDHYGLLVTFQSLTVDKNRMEKTESCPSPKDATQKKSRNIFSMEEEENEKEKKKSRNVISLLDSPPSTPIVQTKNRNYAPFLSRKNRSQSSFGLYEKEQEQEQEKGKDNNGMTATATTKDDTSPRRRSPFVVSLLEEEDDDD